MRHACVALFVSSAVLLVIGCMPQEETQSQVSTSAADQAPTPTTGGAPSDALIKKRIEYLDAMRQVVQVKQLSFSSGLESIDGLIAAQVALYEAELSVASTRDERLAALEASLAKFKQLEDYQQRRSKVGSGRVDELAKAKAGRIHCEMRILEESSRDN